MQQKFSEFEMVFESTIGDKIFGDTVLIWGNFVERNNPHPSPSPSPSHPFKAWVFFGLFSIRSLNSGTTFHGGGGRGKDLFCPFEVGKTSE